MADEPQAQPHSRPNPTTLFPHTTTGTPESSPSSSENKNDGSKLPVIQRDEDGKSYVLDKNGKPYVLSRYQLCISPAIFQHDTNEDIKGVTTNVRHSLNRCRLCTSAAAWRNLTKQSKASTAAASTTTTTQPQSQRNSTSVSTGTTKPECPPDVEALGRSTWTLLHSLTATYPEKASPSEQAEMRSFLTLLSKLYPCWVCADDFRNWMTEPSGRNQPRLGGRSEFGNWMCEAHNEVNRKLGKKEFDCRFWEERWKDGWKDGRCD
jgi:FAD-linked sulfhydryl oxidase